jgi:hypothetical protein
MKLKYSCIFYVVVIGGCASSPMPDTHYRKFTDFIGNVQKCFDDEYITPKLYADTRSAFSYLLSTWTYDSYKLSSMTNRAYSNAYTNTRNCRKYEAGAYELITSSGSHSTKAKENERSWNDAISEITRNKPIYCYTTGTMTMCN